MKNGKTFLLLVIVFVFCLAGASEVVACEKEMAKILGTAAGQFVSEYPEYSVVFVSANRLNQGESRAYTGNWYPGASYIMLGLPYNTRSQLVDLYLYNAKTATLMAKDVTNNAVKVIYSTKPATYTTPMEAWVKMVVGNGCYGFIIYSDE